MKQFSEATRVQMPAMVHLTRLGYSYFGKISEDGAGSVYDADTNILLQVFEQQFKRLNPGHEGEYLQVLKNIRRELNDDDLGLHFLSRNCLPLLEISVLRRQKENDLKSVTFRWRLCGFPNKIVYPCSQNHIPHEQG